MLKEKHLTCPYCGETFTTIVEFSAEDEDYYEDCRICCRPILFRVRSDQTMNFRVQIYRDDE